MRLRPKVKASEFMRFGFKPCRGLPKKRRELLSLREERTQSDVCGQ